VIDWKTKADVLLEEFDLCCRAKPKHNAINIQLEKDSVSKWAVHLNNQRGWGTDTEIAEACHQLEPRLNELKKKLVFEILQNGSI
jgi:hypothetical protein